MLRGILFTCALAATASAEPRHAVYVDMLGKGGLYGIGYDYSPRPYLSFGAVGSYYLLGGDHYLTLAPYVAAYPFTSGHHRWFVQLGPELQSRTTPSPVPEWKGMTTSSISAEVSTGYEYRNKILLRGYVMAEAGSHFAPWAGVSIGWTF